MTHTDSLPPSDTDRGLDGRPLVAFIVGLAAVGVAPAAPRGDVLAWAGPFVAVGAVVFGLAVRARLRADGAPRRDRLLATLGAALGAVGLAVWAAALVFDIAPQGPVRGM